MIITNNKAVHAVATMHGHDCYHDGTQWIFADTNEAVNDNRNRPCSHCRKPPSDLSHDACIANMPGVTDACCGHNNASAAYAVLHIGLILRGVDALNYFSNRGVDNAH